MIKGIAVGGAWRAVIAHQQFSNIAIQQLWRAVIAHQQFLNIAIITMALLMVCQQYLNITIIAMGSVAPTIFEYCHRNGNIRKLPGRQAMH